MWPTEHFETATCVVSLPQAQMLDKRRLAVSLVCASTQYVCKICFMASRSYVVASIWLSVPQVDVSKFHFGEMPLGH
ncbi:hypothetical protein ABIE53_000481 [Burkholderia sp. OAS925]